ncbi:MAG: type II toxin-antitoxin system RelE/ParE family toxin [Maricaulaceae bacterium]|jgi:plasmid stabilization system protein ParE
MKIEWSAHALADLDRFAAFLQRDHPQLSARIGREIISRTELLASNPRLGRRLGDRDEYREIALSVAGAIYVFQYRIDGERLVMLRVFHFRESR